MKILLCVTGAVSSFVIPSHVLHLRTKLNADVNIMTTRSALKFVSKYTLELHSGHPVITDAYEEVNHLLVPHIRLTNEADLILVMPATANIISKAATGICDDVVSTALVAATCPVVFVPSMNGNMWNNQSIQFNVDLLKRRGLYIVDPVEGFEIDGLQKTSGVMASIQTVIDYIRQLKSENKTIL
ncbi:flavoprotein [Gynurincola endophyticus]|uniref:flavoprotein n=1 Tax=Gynurincola endophyticus TaxID=2479004 RepID=UPI0013154BDC|nr:flavoprotein [Gynurincola endophyticus]